MSLAVPQEADVEERKTVSVLFCDLVGFTAMSEHADPEDVRKVLHLYYEMARSELERFGGTVEKFIGDAVMAVFGAPLTHEDDAERAVLAGLAILADLGRTTTGGSLGSPLAVRIGINTGEALVSVGAGHAAGEGIAAGDVVNTAARLQTAAPVGGILVGEVTYRLTRNAIEYSEREPLMVKGKTRPVTIWQVVGPRIRLGTGAPRSTVPFVGRERERSLLQVSFDNVVRDRSPHLITICGEPGVGKSRLVSELLDDARGMSPHATFLSGRCLPYGDGVTFSAMAEMVKSHAGILDTDNPALTREKLLRAVAIAVDDEREHSWVTAMLSPLVGLVSGGQGASREEIFTGWRRFFEALAAREPLVLVFDDLHWADPALLAFIEHLIDTCFGVPLLLVATTRHAPVDNTAGPGSGRSNSAVLRLAPLCESESVQLLDALLGDTALPTDDEAVLVRMCNGNPLYAEEFVRLLRESLAEEGADGAAARSDRSAPRIPETVQTLIAARLDRLDPSDKTLLQSAAVVGTVLWPGAVAAVAGRAESAVRGRLKDLARREFLRPAKTSSVGGQTEYTFWHDLVRDVAYGQIPRPAGAAKHQAFAGWLENMAGNRRAEYAEVLAHHYGQALALTSAAQVGPVEHLQLALCRVSVLAADRAIHLDPEVAIKYYRRALTMMPAQDPQQPAVLLKAAWATTAAGRYDEALKAYQDAFAASLTQGDQRTAGGAGACLANLYRDRGDTASAGVQAAEALALLDGEEPCTEAALTLEFLAFEAWTTGRPAEALRWSNRLLEIAEALDLQEIRGLGLMERGRARLDLDDPEGLKDVIAAVVATRTALEQGDATVRGSWQLLNWQANLAEAVWLVEGTATALGAAQEAQQIAFQRGLLYPSMIVRADGLKVLFDAGRWDELLRDASTVTTSGLAQVSDYWLVVAQTYRAHVLLRRGQLNSAAGLIEKVLPQARSFGDLQILGPALEVAASLQLVRGRLEGAASIVREFADLAEKAPSRRALHLPAFVRVCTAAGDLSLAERLISGTDLRVRRHACAHRAARATLAETKGAFVTALADYEDAAAQWSAYGHTLEHGYSLLGAGRCASRLGRPSAEKTLQAAAEVFDSLGAQALAIETDSWTRDVTPSS